MSLFETERGIPSSWRLLLGLRSATRGQRIFPNRGLMGFAHGQKILKTLRVLHLAVQSVSARNGSSLQNYYVPLGQVDGENMGGEPRLDAGNVPFSLSASQQCLILQHY